MDKYDYIFFAIPSTVWKQDRRRAVPQEGVANVCVSQMLEGRHSGNLEQWSPGLPES